MKTTVREGQDRLRNIGQVLESGAALSEEDRAFLSTALIRIADGANADVELGVKAKRGERKGKNDRISKEKRSFALGWIAVAKTPEAEGGLGLSLEAACAMLGENGLKSFGLTEETLRTYWNRKGTYRGVKFKLDD
jgi:hypothetical protein